MEELKNLVEQYKEIVNSDRNKENKKFWANQEPWYRDMWRGIPKANFKKVPLVVAPENQMWSYIFNMSLIDYYSDPLEHLKQHLKMYIYKFDNWNDNFYFDGNIYIWFSVVTEMSLFGTSIRFFKNREPWLEGKPLLANKKDLDMMENPDFFKSGLMPLVHKYYEVIRNEVDGKLPVIFPNLARGPFCYAAHLRGLDNILMDMISDPDFVHKLMRYIVNSEKNWIKERAKFLKVDKYPSGKLFNDEVGAPMMSPQLYEEFILPYEIELSQFQGGISYWHSCGIVEPITTPFYELIKKIPNLKMMHISPWANDKKAAMVFKDEIALDKCLNPEQDVFSASKEEMEKRIRQIIEDYGEVPKYAIRFDAIEKMHDLEYDLKKIKEFVDIYNNIMGERG